MLAVLPLSSHRKSSPDSNLIICFYKIFYSPRSALRKIGPPLAVYLPGAIKYIDHASKLRSQCEAVLEKPGITAHRQRADIILRRRRRCVGCSVCSWAACACSKREKSRKEVVGVSVANLRHLETSK